MKTSTRGRQLIQRHEGLRLKTYVDPVGVNTIGYGSTGEHAYPGNEITQAQAEEILADDLLTAERAVNRLVTVSLTQSQFDALVSFTFNLGSGALERSTLLRKLNAGDYEGASAEFGRWINGRVNGKLTPLPGLVKRRADEAALFSKGIQGDAPQDALVGSAKGDEIVPTPQQEKKPSKTKALTGAGAAVAGGSETVDALNQAGEHALTWSYVLKEAVPWVLLAVMGAVMLWFVWREWKQHREART